MYHIFIMNSLADGHLVCFHFLAIVDVPAANMAKQVAVESDIESLGYMPSSAIAWSYDGSTFSFWRSLHTDFHSGCSSLQFDVSFLFLVLATLTGVRGTL